MRWNPLLVSFGIGTGLIVLMRVFFPGLAGAVAAVAVAVAFVVVLACVHLRRGTDRQLAGDEAYYLGLLFTLISLIFALLQLFVFPTGDEPLQHRTQELIGNFGVALVSTVAGILVRVLMQSAAEPAEREGIDIDDAPRVGVERRIAAEPVEREGIGISHEVLALRREIRDAMDALAHFRRMAVRSAEEAKTHTETLARTFNEDMVRTMRGELKTGGAAWRTLAKQMAEYQSGLVQQSEQLLLEHVKHLDDGASAKLDETAEAWSKLVSALAMEADAFSRRLEAIASTAADRVASGWIAVAESLRAAADATRDHLRVDSTDIANTLASLQSVQTGLDAVADAVARAAERLDSLSRHADDAAAGLGSRASEVFAAHETLVRDMVALRESANADRRQLEEHADRLHQAVQKLADDGEAQLAATSSNLDAAQGLNKQLSDYADRWSAVANDTNKALTSVVGELTDIVRKG